MKKVLLWDIAGIMLIFKEPSGVLYCNQTGGTGCFQDEMEGVLAPFNNDPPKNQPEKNLVNILTNYLNEICGLSEAQADQLDKILSEDLLTKHVKVDRSKLLLSKEAWVYVLVADSKESTLSGFGNGEGVITWQNSD